MVVPVEMLVLVAVIALIITCFFGTVVAAFWFGSYGARRRTRH